MSDSEPAFVPQAPAVRNPALVRAVDDVYYGMEDATKANAERMAAMTPGASASDFSHTVVTDMKDRQKPGDIAWKPPPMTPGSQPGNWSGGGGMMLPEYAHIAPGAGKSAAAMIQQHHMRANGQPPMRTIGTYMPPRS